MVSEEKTKAFLDYNFTPFNRKQCLIRMGLIWVVSLSSCLIGNRSLLRLSLFVFFNVLISILFMILTIKYPSEKTSRYLCDGSFYLYLSLILNLASYRIFTLSTEEKPFLQLIFLLLLVVFLSVFVVITLSNVKKNKFAATEKSRTIVSLPFVCGAGGILAAQLFLQNQPQQTVLIIIAFALLFFSFITIIPSINLMKWILCLKQKKHVNKMTGDGSLSL